jgi:hypothetical protein
LAAIAFANIRQVISWGPEGARIMPSEQLPTYVAAAIQSVKVKTRVYTEMTLSGEPRTVNQTEIEFTMHSKLKALETLRREFALYRHNQAFLNAFTELVLTHVQGDTARREIYTFLAEQSGVQALDAIQAFPRAAADVPGGASDRAGPDARGGPDA